MSKTLVLIASYPKSGNTWVRLFLENLRRGAGEPVSINDIGTGIYGHERRRLFDHLAPALASELSPDQQERFLPAVFAHLAIEARECLVVKTHDRARMTSAGDWLIPPEHVRAVVYITRHPFDVALSYAHHRGVSVAQAAADLCDEGHAIAWSDDRLHLPLSEKVGSWSTNVASWLDAPLYPVHHVRYEDMYAAPLQTFSRLACAAGLDASEAAIASAIAATSFENFAAEESRSGFAERPAASRAFFRSGRPGQGGEQLDRRLRQQIVDANRAVMRFCGYEEGGAYSA